MISPEIWIGYLEHQTPDLLWDFTANTGKGGCTIFAAHLWATQRRWLFGLPWCATFVHAVVNRPELLGRAHPGCRVLARRMRLKKRYVSRGDYLPVRGDLIFLSNLADGVIDHVGIVTACDGELVISVEGNGPDPLGRFRPDQGGVVVERVRRASDPKIVGYAILS